MSTTALTRPSPPSSAAKPWSEQGRDARSPVSEPSAVGDWLGEVLPAIGFVFVAGPPVVFVVGPWLVFVLVLIPPVALLLTLAAVLVAVTVAVALVGAVLASPYLLVRHVRGRRARHASIADPAAQHVPVESLRAAA